MVSRTACGLKALGFTAGDRVTILSSNCPEWVWADLAAMCLGGGGAGIYPNDLPDQVEYVNEHSEARVAFVDTVEQLAKTDGFRSRLDSLQKVVVFHASDAELPDDPKVISFEAFLEGGKSLYETEPGAIEGEARAISMDTVCMMVYTSGTTGRPKGATYDHANLAFEGELLARELGGDDNVSISFLPLCHIAERLQGEIVAIQCGNAVWFAESIDRLKDNLLEVRPTILLCVPRLWEKFYAGIRAGFGEATGVKKVLVDRTMAVGARVCELRNRGGEPRGLLAAEWGLLEKLVVSKLKGKLGLDRCTAFISGAAPLAGEISAFFGALGIDIRETYGQTESVGVISVNPEFGVRPGTVGKPLEGSEVRIGDQGEILARGPHVFRGYHKNERATQETVDPDGWLHTGDVGEFTEEGYIRITDRLKDIIVTAGGKNVAPQNIENKLKLHPGISQVVVIGDKRPYLVALVTLDETATEAFCGSLGIPHAPIADLAESTEVHARIQEYIDTENATVARYETIKYFQVLPRDLTVEAEEVTPTLKVKRRVVQVAYADRIESMYAGGSPASS